MSLSANLGLSFLQPAQAQKHVTMNEALARLDALVQMRAQSRSVATPPAGAVEGASYLVPVAAVDAWQGRDGEIAYVSNGGWEFVTPQVGWQVWVLDEGGVLTYDGQGWNAGLIASSYNGAQMRGQVLETDISVVPGADFETAALIPKDCSVWAVTGRILTDITGTLISWSLGVDQGETRYGNEIGLLSGSYVRGVTGQPVAYYSDTPLKLTAIGGEFASGSVRLAIHLMRFDIPN